MIVALAVVADPEVIVGIVKAVIGGGTQVKEKKGVHQATSLLTSVGVSDAAVGLLRCFEIIGKLDRDTLA